MIITAVILYKDHIYHSHLEMDQTLSVGSHKKDDIRIEEWEPHQMQISWRANGISVLAKKPLDYAKSGLILNQINIISHTEQVAVFFSTSTSQDSTGIKLPYNCALKVGRSNANDIAINSTFVSEPHFTVIGEEGVYRFKDEGSTNGVFLNGKQTKAAKLKSGDILSILSIQIRFQNGQLFFDNVQGMLTIRDLSDHILEAQSYAEPRKKRLEFHRSPRTQEQLPKEEIVLAAAPTKANKFEKGRGMLSSLAGTGAMMVASALTTAASPALLAARAATMISPITNIAANAGTNKKRKKSLEQYEALRIEKYGAYIAEQKARIESVAETQREILTRENPTPEACLDVLYGLRRNLWERMPSDRDFLDVRIGMGYEDLCVPVKSRSETYGIQMESDEVRELSEQIIEETRIVDNVPARLHLLQYGTVGIIGNRSKVMRLVRNMLISLATLHCFEDVRIAGIFNQEERTFWNPIKWLPHIWDDDNKQSRFLAFSKKDSEKCCELLQEEIKTRQKLASENAVRNGQLSLPVLVLIFGSKDLVERETIMNDLFSLDPALGVVSIFLFDEIYMLPHECRYIVDVDNGPCVFKKSEANKKTYFTLDPAVETDRFDSFARRMSAVQLIGFRKNAGLPSGITFLKGYGVKTVEQIDILRRWENSRPWKSLAAPIGVLENGKPFELDIQESERAHGPHGLVAGTTGSGKSELLRTWIISMALNYHPYDVNFIIIDYKGGRMAAQIENLPHVVGKIDNIGSNIKRALILINSEVIRRQRIFDAVDVSNINKYQELYRRGVLKEPLPHLIIVADEFAELKEQEPEFISDLVSISRIGRSLGVHLILATQRPGGIVSDQIASNSRLRLCLKVQNGSDSREMIKRPDAARITQAGRTYIRVGEDEYFDLFQSYWSGATYYGENPEANEAEHIFYAVSDRGERTSAAEKKDKDDKSKKAAVQEADEMSALVEQVLTVARESGVQKLQGPLIPELPERITLSEMKIQGAFDGTGWSDRSKWLSIPVGVYDSPKTQSQGIQFVDFAAEGHYGIYGAPGTGKSSLLKEIVMALGLFYTPEDVNIYILDCGGWSMKIFEQMPHVGGVALDIEEEKYQVFANMILEEFDLRKNAFLKNRVNSLAAYREEVGKDIPAIIIAIDNFAALFELFPDLENLLVTIARDGATYGIYLLFTANTTSGIRYKVLQNIGGAIAFDLIEKGDYQTLVGKPESLLPKISGRAFMKGNPPVEFQAALCAEGASDREQNHFVQGILAEMNQSWRGKRAKRIPVIPEKVLKEDLLPDYVDRVIIPVGLEKEKAKPAFMDLAEKNTSLIIGSEGSGKSQTLVNICDLILSKHRDARIYVFDSSSAPLDSLRNKAFRYQICQKESAELDEMTESLLQEITLRKQDVSTVSSRPMVCIIIDDLYEFTNKMADDNHEKIVRIVRMGRKLDVVLLAAMRTEALESRIGSDILTGMIVSNQQALAVDGSPSQMLYLKSNLSYSEKKKEAGEGEAYLFDDGQCTLIKLLQ